MAIPMAPWTTSQDSQADFEFSQTQRDPVRGWDGESLGASQVQNSQVNPRSKYWAVFTSLSGHMPIKLFWPSNRYPGSTAHALPGESGSARLGRGPYPRYNDFVYNERRVSNRHCLIGRLDERSGAVSRAGTGRSDSEPIVFIEDLGSSNGTYVNGKRIARTPHKQILRHGDEISLGGQATDEHDVRYIYRSVGEEGMPTEPVGGIFEKYYFRETLGAGTFAEVKKAVEISTGIVRAVKCITRHKFQNHPRTMEMFQREIEILRELDHENICEFIEVWDDPQHIYLVLEYVDGGDLLDFIMKRADPGPGLQEVQAKELTTMICRAMAYTHSLGVAHRDLKPENILLTSDNPPIIKVADFGLAKMVDEGTALRTMVGTPQYLAPEVVLQTPGVDGYENVVDSWAVGVIVYSMMTNALPFDENPDDPVHVRIRNRLEQPFDYGFLREIGMSEAGIDFIECLLRKDPADRMTLTDALTHAWLRDGGELRNSTESSLGRRLGHRQNGSFDRMSHTSTVHGIDGVEETPYLGGGSSMEDFSNPMDRLRLQTPGGTISSKKSSMSLSSNKARLAGQSSFFGGDMQEMSPQQPAGRMIDSAPLLHSHAPQDDIVGDSQQQDATGRQLEGDLSEIYPPSPIPMPEDAEDGALPSASLDVRVIDYAGVSRNGASTGPSSIVTSARKRRYSQSSVASSSSLSSVPDDSQPHVIVAKPARKKVARDPPAPTRSSARIRQSTGSAAAPKTPSRRAKRG